MAEARGHLHLVEGSGEEERSGRVPTVDEAFRRYAPYVASIALRLLGKPDEVDDLVQDVFIEAHKGFRSIRNGTSVKRWLGRVTVRVAHRRLVRRKRWKFLGFSSDEDYSELADQGASPEDRALLSKVYSALDELPPPLRIAWALRHIQGERLDQVALMCDCSLATVKRRISAAHAAIREATDEG